MKKPRRLSPALLLVGIALLIALGAWLGSSWLNNHAAMPKPAPNRSIAGQPITMAPIVPTRSTTNTLSPTATQTVEPTLEFIVLVPPETTPYPTFDVSFAPTIAARSDWLTYQDDLEGFSINYPQGWKIREMPLETRQTSIVYTTSIVNFDLADPALANRKGLFPHAVFRFDIITSKPGSTGIPLRPGQTLEEWVEMYQTLPEDVRLIRGRNLIISGAQAHEIIWQRPSQPVWTTTFIAKNDRVFVLDYWLYTESVTLSETAEQMIESFRFTR